MWYQGQILLLFDAEYESTGTKTQHKAEGSINSSKARTFNHFFSMWHVELNTFGEYAFGSWNFFLYQGGVAGGIFLKKFQTFDSALWMAMVDFLGVIYRTIFRNIPTWLNIHVRKSLIEKFSKTRQASKLIVSKGWNVTGGKTPRGHPPLTRTRTKLGMAKFNWGEIWISILHPSQSGTEIFSESEEWAWISVSKWNWKFSGIRGRSVVLYEKIASKIFRNQRRWSSCESQSWSGIFRESEAGQWVLEVNGSWDFVRIRGVCGGCWVTIELESPRRVSLIHSCASLIRWRGIWLP